MPVRGQAEDSPSTRSTATRDRYKFEGLKVGLESHFSGDLKARWFLCWAFFFSVINLHNQRKGSLLIFCMSLLDFSIDGAGEGTGDGGVRYG